MNKWTNKTSGKEKEILSFATRHRRVWKCHWNRFTMHNRSGAVSGQSQSRFRATSALTWRHFKVTPCPVSATISSTATSGPFQSNVRATSEQRQSNIRAIPEQSLNTNRNSKHLKNDFHDLFRVSSASLRFLPAIKNQTPIPISSNWSFFFLKTHK